MAQDTYNQEETMKGTTLEQEYDATFDGEEKVNNLLKIDKNAFTRVFRRIKISEIGLTDPVKRARLQTIRGLTETVKRLGVVNPIHVMALEVEDDDDDTKYILLDGFRRLYGAKRNGHDDIDAIVWDFEDKDQGLDLALYLGLLLNKANKHKWSEIWDLYQILELQSDITPGTLEYLLQLESGDAMKLKDIMLCDYPEVKDTLLTEKKNLEGCYKMLQKLRKEEDTLAKEDTQSLEDAVEGAETIENADDSSNKDESGNRELSDEEVRDILEMNDDVNLADDDNITFQEMNQNDYVDKQKVGERRPLDKALREAVMGRDKYTCQCCGLKMNHSARPGILAVHHIIPVHASGPDTMENLTTLCENCHITLHIMERSGGSILMSKESFQELDETERTILTNIYKLVRKAIIADKQQKLSKDDIMKQTQSAIRHRMPGEGFKENQESYAAYERKQKAEQESKKQSVKPQEDVISADDFGGSAVFNATDVFQQTIQNS